jgi:hypothetical protein
MIEIATGLLFAALLVYASRYWQLESWSYTLSLIFLPLIYMVFGLFSEGDDIVLMEFCFGIPYFIIATIGMLREFKGSAYVVAGLWFLHAMYDLIHNQLFINTGIFDWYPYFCAAVDFAISAYILWASRLWPSANIRLADTHE